jgi:hypothetical protein
LALAVKVFNIEEEKEGRRTREGKGQRRGEEGKGREG